ncbi:MAG: hypothetical protein KatS3mg002_1360 [Candidatus Woesearchaeota archaeon]|nr:MAG: hypothetical protein KatS3mg002_1360 [Candidatus Woesearchaeota archaeon]
MESIKKIFTGYLNWAKDELGILEHSKIERAKKRFEVCIGCENFDSENNKCKLCTCPSGSIRARIFSDINACPDTPSRWKE